MEINALISEILSRTENEQKQIVSAIKNNAPEASPLSEIIIEWDVIIDETK